MVLSLVRWKPLVLIWYSWCLILNVHCISCILIFSISCRSFLMSYHLLILSYIPSAWNTYQLIVLTEIKILSFGWAQKTLPKRSYDRLKIRVQDLYNLYVMNSPAGNFLYLYICRAHVQISCFRFCLSCCAHFVFCVSCTRLCIIHSKSQNTFK